MKITDKEIVWESDSSSDLNHQGLAKKLAVRKSLKNSEIYSEAKAIELESKPKVVLEESSNYYTD